MGRAASVNSPEGLWPPPPQRGLPPQFLKPVVRSSSGGEFGSRSRGCGEEGRVRGGLPRISSVPSLLAGNTSSPNASNISSPAPAAQSSASPFDSKRPVATFAEFLARKVSQFCSRLHIELYPWDSMLRAFLSCTLRSSCST